MSKRIPKSGVECSAQHPGWKTSKERPKPQKRILDVRIKHIPDEAGARSDYLGEYGQKPTSEFSIDRVHTEECASVSDEARHARQTLVHAEAYLASSDFDEQISEASDILCSLADEVTECDCGERGPYNRGEYRYFNPSFNYVDKNGRALPDNTPEDIRKYVRQDYERCEALNAGHWYYLGIRAEADVQYPAYGGSPAVRTEKVTSGGLWGIESDSDASYFAEVQKEELADLKDQLVALGFSKRAVATAFKDVQEVSE